MTTPLPTPPGWYPDPSGVPGTRYFDGGDWTDQCAPSMPSQAQSHFLMCPRCHSNEVRVQVVEKVRTKRRGPFMWLLWIVLGLLTCGLILVIPLITNSKTISKTQRVAVCQTCGHTWRP